MAWQPVGLRTGWLQIDRSGLSFATFLPNTQILGCKIVQNLPVLGPIFAFDDPTCMIPRATPDHESYFTLSPTGRQAASFLSLLDIRHPA
jgi:hypothetical protein